LSVCGDLPMSHTSNPEPSLPELKRSLYHMLRMATCQVNTTVDNSTLACSFSHSPCADKVEEWLTSLYLHQYTATLVENGYDSEHAVRSLNTKALHNIGVKAGHCRVICDNLAQFSSIVK